MHHFVFQKAKRTKREERLSKRKSVGGGLKFGWIQGVLVSDKATLGDMGDESCIILH